MARTGKCFLCGSPSKAKTNGGSRERCEPCGANNNHRASYEWRARNKERVRIAQRAWRQGNRELVKAHNKAWRQTNPESVRITRRKDHLKRTFGLSLDGFAAILGSQDGRCAICQTPDSGKRNWRVDHDHQTGAIRGLLCNSCNVGLGAFKDRPENLLAAERYVQRSGLHSVQRRSTNPASSGA